MNHYHKIILDLCDEKGEDDPITLQRFNTLNTLHPRSTMTIRRENGIPYPIDTKTVIELIDSGYSFDPSTHEPFSPLTIQRAKMYWQGMLDYPDITIHNLDTVQIFRDWMIERKMDLDDVKSNHHQFDIDDRLRKIFKARCFLQAEDLVTLFRSYHRKGSLDNRRDVLSELKGKPVGTWLIRNSSITDEKYEKVFALSVIGKNRCKHFLILHRIGEGFFSAVANNRKEGQSAKQLEFGIMGFICIIDIIEYLLRNNIHI